MYVDFTLLYCNCNCAPRIFCISRTILWNSSSSRQLWRVLARYPPYQAGLGFCNLVQRHEAVGVKRYWGGVFCHIPSSWWNVQAMIVQLISPFSSILYLHFWSILNIYWPETQKTHVLIGKVIVLEGGLTPKIDYTLQQYVFLFACACQVHNPQLRGIQCLCCVLR